MDQFRKNAGFTLLEMLLVVAVIAVLTAIAIPITNAQLEKSKNAVDMYTAKTMADVVQIYYATNPDAMEELQAACAPSGGAHYVQISVGPDNAAIAPVLRQALFEAGLINSAGGSSTTRFPELTSKSLDQWKGYYIGFTTFVNGETVDYIKVGYYGTTSDTIHTNRNYALLFDDNAVDSTGFKDAMLSRE